nr:MAG TPA_asm: hypothetical protein [Caudoviricetes sp.]
MRISFVPLSLHIITRSASRVNNQTSFCGSFFLKTY